MRAQKTYTHTTMIDIHIVNDILTFALKYITFAWTGAYNTWLHLCVHFFRAPFIFFLCSFGFYQCEREFEFISRELKLQQQQLNSVCLYFSFLYVYYFLHKCNFLRQTNIVYICVSSKKEQQQQPELADENFMPEFYWYLYNDFVCCFGILRYQNSFLNSDLEQRANKKKV